MNKHTYEVDINKANFDIMTCKLDMTEDETNFILEYRDKFKLLTGEESALVSLEQLWEVLGSPYGGFKHWKSEVVVTLCKRLSSEISDERLPTKGRPKINSFVDTDIAKHLALLVNSESGDIARRYFITVEKLFKNALEYNIKLIGIEQSRKKVSHNGFKTGGKSKGWNESKRYNRLMAEAIGARHSLETDVNEYAHACKTVERMMLKGCNDDLILAAVA